MHQSDQTQDSRDPAQDYVLGNSVQEQNRLQYQAAILEKWTGQFFVSAGIEPGMKVLDLGCGMGDVSLLAARLVGPTGKVIGIDRDRVILEKARERAHRAGRGANIEFLCAEVLEVDSPSSFDAVAADELDVETLMARMDTEALACHSQLIGPLQFGAWTRKP